MFKKIVLSFFIFSIIGLYSQCPSYLSFKVNDTNSVVKVCFGDTIRLTSQVQHALGRDSVRYFWDSTSSYNPYTALGRPLGSAKINTALGTAPICPSCTTACSQCPSIQSIFINSCNGSGAEQDNEFVIFHSGSGFNASDFQFTYNSTNSIGAANLGINIAGSSCTLQTPTNSLMDSIRSSIGCDTNNTKRVTPTMAIPPNSYVIFFCSSNVTKKYDFSTICASGLTLYVMQSSCQRTSGAFTNSASSTLISTQILGLSSCSACKDTFRYSRAGLANTDGEYAIRDASGTSSVANGTVLVNTINPCNGPIEASYSVDTLRFVVNQTTMCGRDTLYLKGIFRNHPNTGGCPNTATIATSNTVKLVVMCPNALVTVPNYFCDGDSITAKGINTNPRPAAINLFSWENSLGSSIGVLDSTIIRASGTYLMTLNENGCTDTQSFSVTKSNPISNATNASLDSCQSVRFKGITYAANTTAFDTLRTANGLCDSIIYQQPIIILKNDTQHTTACFKAGNSYVFRGNTYSAPGHYYLDSATTKKCFKVFHLDLGMIPVTRDTNRLYTCQPSYILSGRIYTADTTHRDTIKNTLGCDSFIHEFPISFIQKITKSTNQLSACNTYTHKGITYSSNTTVYDTIRSTLAPSCDSVITPIFIEIYPAPTRITKTTLDSCLHVRYKGITYTANTIVYDTLKKSNGLCDSIIYQTPIVIIRNDTTQLTACINSGGSYNFYGSTLTSPGIYYHRIPASKGCDSIIQLNLTRAIPNSVVRDTAACDSFLFKARIYKSNTIIPDTLRNIQGCDSLIRLYRVTIWRASLVQADTMKGCGEVIFRGNRITTNSVFDSVIQKKMFPYCDSIVNKVYIVILSLPNGNIAISPDTLVPQGSIVQLTASGGVGYTWLINNTTNNPLVYTIQERTYFEVRIRDRNNCEQKIGKWVSVEADIEIIEAFSPNGDGINDEVAPILKGPVLIQSFKIYNRWGQLVYEGSGSDARWNGKFKGDDQPQGSYVYFIQYSMDGRQLSKSGGLTLIK